MKRIVAALAVLALLAAPSAALAKHRSLAATPAPLTYSARCIQSDGSYGALVTGAGTVNQPIDWSPFADFHVIQSGVDNHLEGESGALGFWVALPPPAYGISVAYPNGVWVRWSNFPSVVTHIPVPWCIAHVVIVWMENYEASAITATSMPYLYGLSQTYGRATAVYAETHPSQPNYVAFWSGSTQGITDDANHDVTAASLSSQLTAAGKQWRNYSQSYPVTGCNTAATYPGYADGPGVIAGYARKHVPAMSFTSVTGTPTECAKVQPLSAFSPTAASVASVAPNLCNDVHDCSLATGDAFLAAFLPSVFNSPDWAHTLLIVTFDEGTTSVNGGGNIFTMIARPFMGHVVSSTFHMHYGMLRTVEDALGLPCLGAACSAVPFSEFLP
jgi:hypothetical protein